MVSIRQTTYPDSLPDFHNLGVIARVLVAVNAIALGGALFATPDLAQAIDRFPQIAALVEPLLLACLVVLFVLSPLLARLPYWAGCAAVMALVLLVTVLLHAAVTAIAREPPAELGRMLLLAALIGAGLLGYFRLLARAYSPALAEARLQALQARIRPHFLFNSLNAVLALIRRDPKRAERSLEDLAALFRSLMSDARRFVRLADEIALLERAVYHGVEPSTGVGDVLVRIERRGDRVLARIENPRVEAPSHRAGNRMALDNIRERLALFFDAEARIETSAR